MDSIQVLLLIFFIAGCFLMVFMFFKLKNDDDGGKSSYLETGNSIKAINSSIDDAEKVIEELNALTATVISDINAKHQELLFIYNLIDEKKSELKSSYGAGRAREQKRDAPSSWEAAVAREALDAAPKKDGGKSAKPVSYIHPKHKEIAQMHEKGQSIAEISKNLSMGQGEIKLILELIKAR